MGGGGVKMGIGSYDFQKLVKEIKFVACIDL